jgi:hypothetical protein
MTRNPAAARLPAVLADGNMAAIQSAASDSGIEQLEAHS